MTYSQRRWAKWAGFPTHGPPSEELLAMLEDGAPKIMKRAGKVQRNNQVASAMSLVRRLRERQNEHRD